MAKKKTLFDYDRENEKDALELQDLSARDHAAFRKLYREAIAERAETLSLPDELLQGLADAQNRGIAKLRVGALGPNDDDYDVIEGYLVARYGGDPRAWPEEIDGEKEKARVDLWLSGVRPLGGGRVVAVRRKEEAR